MAGTGSGMTVTAIIHSATRVIYGLTTDEPPELHGGMEGVVVPDDTSLLGGPFTIDDSGVMTPASEATVRLAFAGTGFEDEMAAQAVANGR